MDDTTRRQAHLDMAAALEPFLGSAVAMERAAQLTMALETWEPGDPWVVDVRETIARSRLAVYGETVLPDHELDAAVAAVLAVIDPGDCDPLGYQDLPLES